MKRDEHAEIRSIILCDSETEKNAVENAFERSIQVIFNQTVFLFIILNQLTEDYFQNSLEFKQNILYFKIISRGYINYKNMGLYLAIRGIQNLPNNRDIKSRT